MKKLVYLRSADAKGEASWTFLGTFETWRETHAVRTFTKESRMDNRTKTPRASFVYDERGNLLCTP